MAAGKKSGVVAQSGSTGRVYVGIGGWDFAPWRGRFFPDGLPHARELQYASRQLSSIEINGTFYRTQTPAQYAEWHDAVPEDFVFAVKAHRAATAGRDPAKAADGVARFLESGLDRLGSKLGPLLWQFTNRRFDAHEMEAFLAGLPVSLGALPLRHAIEARHESFAGPDWVALLRQYGVAQVIVDSDKQMLAGNLTADFVYARLQRNASGEREGYSSQALDTWAKRAQSWRSGEAVGDLPLVGAPENRAFRATALSTSSAETRNVHRMPPGRLSGGWPLQASSDPESMLWETAVWAMRPSMIRRAVSISS